MGRPMLRAQSAPPGIPPIGDQTTYPGPPPGFTAQVLYSAPAAGQYDPNANVDTLDLTFFAPALLTPDQIIAAMQSFLDQAPTFGWNVLAYEIDTMLAGEFDIPSQICIPSLPCIDVPGSICVPNIPPGNCWFSIDLAGSQVSPGYSYRLWLAIADPSLSPSLAPRGMARGDVRGLIPAALIAGLPEAITILIVLIGLLFVYEVLTGHISFGSIAQTTQGIATGVGSLPVPAIQAAENPLILLGIAMIISGVAIPVVLNANATVPIPGGGSVGAGGSIGGTGGRR